MHFADVSKSERLQRVLQGLKLRPMTTMELVREANVCAVNSIVAELRANGYRIDCECLARGVFRYTLMPKEEDTPSFKSLLGKVPDLTGGKSAADFIRSIREEDE